jgi:hypothetical protein
VYPQKNITRLEHGKRIRAKVEEIYKITTHAKHPNSSTTKSGASSYQSLEFMSSFPTTHSLSISKD